MKREIIFGTALAANGLLSGQVLAAEPIKVSFSGFMEQWVGYSDNETDNGAKNYSEVSTFSDVEMFLKGSTRLDNGLSVGITFEIERSGGTIDGVSDESYLTISSDQFGVLKVGSTMGVSYGLSNHHWDVGVLMDDGVHQFFAVNALGDEIDTTHNTSDGHKIIYLSPNLAGLQAGFSYGLIDESNLGTVDTQAEGNDLQYNAGVVYNATYEDLSVSVDLNYELIEDGGLTGGGTISALTEGTDQVKNEESWRAGFTISQKNWTISGAFLETDNKGTVTGKESTAWEAGVTYKMGPYGFSAGYFNRQTEDSGLSGALEDTTDLYLLSASYKLGPGVTLAGSLTNIVTDDASDRSPNQTDEGSNWALITGIKAHF
ncbi:porin [Terasakiella sp. SH-1]|uniref:porin n=1 Tax=Terasakiella sp. SH-1 TaxID=2560057 RepID=UPI00142F96DC|nr:porin [Terasakiella sp. SH-1]